MAVSEWQRRLAITYQNASGAPDPIEGMKCAVEHHEGWDENDYIIGDNERFSFEENEIFESLKYLKTAQVGSEARLLESIESGMQCISDVLATIRSRKEAANGSSCIVEHAFSPLLRICLLGFFFGLNAKKSKPKQTSGFFQLAYEKHRP